MTDENMEVEDPTPFVLWDALCDMYAWPEGFATVEEALEVGRQKMEAYKRQGHYTVSAPQGLRIPFERLKLGVLWEGLSPEEFDALTLFVADDRRPGGFVQRSAR